MAPHSFIAPRARRAQPGARARPWFQPSLRHPSSPCDDAPVPVVPGARDCHPRRARGRIPGGTSTSRATEAAGSGGAPTATMTAPRRRKRRRAGGRARRADRRESPLSGGHARRRRRAAAAEAAAAEAAAAEAAPSRRGAAKESSRLGDDGRVARRRSGEGVFEATARRRSLHIHAVRRDRPSAARAATSATCEARPAYVKDVAENISRACLLVM